MLTQRLDYDTGIDLCGLLGRGSSVFPDSQQNLAPLRRGFSLQLNALHDSSKANAPLVIRFMSGCGVAWTSLHTEASRSPELGRPPRLSIPAAPTSPLAVQSGRLCRSQT